MTNIPNWILTKTPIFHITHIDNLESILSNGGLYSKNHLPCNVKSIANEDVQDKRASTIINTQYNLHDYVPFYFAPRSPMLFVHHKAGIINAQPQEQIIHLVSFAQKINNLPFIFSDRHAIVKIAQFYTDLNDLKMINWERFFQLPLIGKYAKYWQPTSEWPDREEIRQAEFLVYKNLPWEFINAVATMSKDTADIVEALFSKLGIKTTVTIRPEWYY